MDNTEASSNALKDKQAIRNVRTTVFALIGVAIGLIIIVTVVV